MKVNSEKIFVFGTGDYYYRYREFLRNDIVGFFDNDISKQGELLDGVRIYAPEKVSTLMYDRIYILSVYGNEIKKQLLCLGVEEEKIFLTAEVKKLLANEGKKLPVRLTCLDSTNILPPLNEKCILLITPDLRLNGAQIALLGLIRFCQAEGFEPVVASMQGGPLVETLVCSGIKVVIDPNLAVRNMADISWLKGFPMILCNTVIMGAFLSTRPKGIPVIWWLHDPPFMYELLEKNIFSDLDYKDLYIYSAGRIAADAFADASGKKIDGFLPYGLEDKVLPQYKNKQGYVFMIAGDVQDWKGQDIFAEAAAEIVSETNTPKVEFHIIGNNETRLGRRLKDKYKNCPSIKFTGIYDRKQMLNEYAMADVYVCASRQEVMSITVTEAMRQGLPCIVSDEAGNNEFIKDGENGLVFPSGNSTVLAECMRWCISNQEQAKIIGKRSRKIYENFFSDNVFAKHFRQIVRHITNCSKRYY